MNYIHDIIISVETREWRKLADAPDLGSGALRRGGSSPFSRTNFIAPFEVLFFLPKNVIINELELFI